MDVPLAAERTIRDGDQLLTVWAKGRPRVVEPPIDPYCYARRPFARGVVDQREVTRRPLSTLAPETWIRARFPNVRALADEAHKRPDEELAEAHLPFVHRVLLDRPDFYRGFPNGELTRMTFDIEQRTTGEGFPTAQDPIVSIAWAVDEGDPVSVLGDGQTDTDPLEAFLDALETHDPDVLLGYNLTRYDLPRLLDRLEANQLPTAPVTRTGGRVDDARFGEGVRLVGRLAYDVYDAVRADQTLAGIKDRRLSTVARWHGMDVVEEDPTHTSRIVGTERLRRYNENDVELTRAIARPYLSNAIRLAEFYGAPLQTVAEATASFHCTTLQGRIMVEEDVVSDGRNDERYPELYAQTGGEGFVGGIVEIYQRGRFAPVTLVDFSSMYPSILVALGCGADNTIYRGSVSEGPYRARRTGDGLTLLVPDPARDTRHEIEIRGRSRLAEELGELLDYRLGLKERARTADPAERSEALSRQGVVKVILNSVYGVMASRHARYGSLPVAMAVVGTARRLIRTVEDELGEAKIETDTDGVYAVGEVDPGPIQARANRFIEDELGAEPRLAVDAERFEAGFFHEGKNYLLLHDDGRLERHGVAFKGSSRAPLFDEALDRVGRAVLEGREDVDEVASRALDLSRYEPEDFVMRVRLGKDPDAYEATNHVAAQVARAAIERGRDVSQGDQIPYVKTTDGYDVAWEGAFEQLDEAYYLDLLAKLLARLDIEARPADQMSLSEFM